MGGQQKERLSKKKGGGKVYLYRRGKTSQRVGGEGGEKGKARGQFQ